MKQDLLDVIDRVLLAVFVLLAAAPALTCAAYAAFVAAQATGRIAVDADSWLARPAWAWTGSAALLAAALVFAFAAWHIAAPFVRVPRAVRPTLHLVLVGCGPGLAVLCMICGVLLVLQGTWILGAGVVAVGALARHGTRSLREHWVYARPEETRIAPLEPEVEIVL